MYLTKLSERTAGAEDPVRDLNGSYLYRGTGTDGTERMATVYRFATLAELSAGCVRLFRDGYSGRSEAYADRRRGGAFYLVLDGEMPVLAEYNGRRIPARSVYFVKEHFSLFSRDAVTAIRGYYEP